MTTIRTALRYPGGKSKAIKPILAMFPKSAQEYREPFLGGGSVFLAVKQCSFASTYWVNDLDEDLMAFWLTVANKAEMLELVKTLTFTRNLLAEEDLRRLHSDLFKSSSHRSKFDRAYRFFVLNRISFSGSTQAGGFSASSANQRFTESSIERIKALTPLLSGVRVTNNVYDSCVLSPGKDVFIFGDPPYYHPKKLYGKKGTLQLFDHPRLASLLQESGHKFLLTYDDCPEIRKLYSWANIKPFTLQYSMTKADENNHRRRGNELFIYNYDLPGEHRCP